MRIDLFQVRSNESKCIVLWSKRVYLLKILYSNLSWRHFFLLFFFCGLFGAHNNQDIFLCSIFFLVCNAVILLHRFLFIFYLFWCRFRKSIGDYCCYNVAKTEIHNEFFLSKFGRCWFMCGSILCDSNINILPDW